MIRRRIIFFALFFFAFGMLFAQQTKKDSILSFTLKSAQDYALQNSPVIKNANLDLESAKKKIFETTAIGLPQVNSKFAYSYQISIPDMEKQFSGLTQLGGWMYGVDSYLAATSGNHNFGHIAAPDPNQKTITDNQLRWGLTYDITATQLIFSGSYIVALQTSKIYKQFSELGITKSMNDVSEQVSNAYYLVLIAQENKNILDSTYFNTSKILDYVTSMNAQGLIEETDVDQMQLTVSTLKNALDMLERQVEVAKNLLKFQMGIELTQNIALADNLSTMLIPSDLAVLELKEFNVENNSDFKLMETQEKLSGLNLKFQKSSFLPDIAAFYTHEENFNKNSFSFTPPNMIGLSMNIPIFGSGSKISKIQQAKIALEKAKNSKEQVSLGLQTSFLNAKSLFITALNTYTTKKQNVQLAEKIYNKSLVKYKEGIIGSLELTLAQNQYLQAQSDYYTSIIDLSSSKSKFEKILK